MKTTDVRFWDVRKLRRRTPTCEVRWVVDGKVRSRTRRTKALAEAFLAELRQAARRGELFDTESGLPDSLEPPPPGTSWLQLAQQYLDTKWPRAAAKSRDSMTDALATVTAILVTDRSDAPHPRLARSALRQYLLPPSSRSDEPSDELRPIVEWLVAHSLPITELSRPAQLRRALDGLTLTLNGSPAAATTVRRKRAVFHNALQYAVEIEVLSTNNLDKIGWRAPKVTDVIDRRVVINPKQARELLTAVTYVGPVDRGRHLRGFFAAMYFAALRPSEAQGLRIQDCELPVEGWGYVNLVQSRPEANSRWSDTGDTHERRQLKHRAAGTARRVPIPPELVLILREHAAEFGTAPDGRLFRTRRGGVLGSNYADAWARARHLAFTPEQVLSPLAARPYDLRHAAVSLWLNSGVAAPDVAERAGHGVDVLLRVYAACLDGGESAANTHIENALTEH